VIVTRAISLTQPWATLMAIGAKQVETHSWSWRTLEGTWLAIHAAKRFPRECVTLCYQRPFCDALAASGIEDLRNLPTGAAIAIARYGNCVPTTMASAKLSKSELAFGNYSPGRWAWVFYEVRRLREPIPMKGRWGSGACRAASPMRTWHEPR